MMDKPHVVILGAGPAGLGAAYRLAHRGIARVTVLESTPAVGGIAGSFELAGQRVDYGSHRLHPACDAEILADIRALLGDELLERPRHGRIRLKGRWIRFPLHPLDLALQLPPTFALGTAADLLSRLVQHRDGDPTAANFASIMEATLGRTICRDFYFPYAQKMWGLPPEALSAMQARRRVSANSFGKLARKLLSAVPGFKSPTSGRFYYPRGGFGQIAEAYARAAVEDGATLKLNAKVESVVVEPGTRAVSYRQGTEVISLPADHIWSTLPITQLAHLLTPSLPPTSLEAADQLHYRAMLLIYLLLDQDRFSEYDAHYFPQMEVPLTRLSEPKNYSGHGPAGQTVLCAEMPCAIGGSEWQMDDMALSRLVAESLERMGIPLRAPVRQVLVHRLRQAYPIYAQGYETSLQKLDDAVSQTSGLLSFGRQGLFAHDNIHHALAMGYRAADCLRESGDFDSAQWRQARECFREYVVED